MLNLMDLDERTRRFMLAEIEHDLQRGDLYYGKRLTPAGRSEFPGLLKLAVTSFNDEWLAEQIRKPGMLKQMETATRNGREYEKRVPHNAHESLAEGEFNRFFARGLCLCAMDVGIAELVIYRAKHADSPRIESQQRIGTRVAPNKLLDDLRDHIGRDTAFGVPGGVNSGLSVCLPDTYKTISGS